MYATAVVGGKVVRFKLSPGLARAHRRNQGKTMTEAEAVAFVEAKRRARALRRARPYRASRAPVSVARPGEFLDVPEVGRFVKKLIRG